MNNNEISGEVSLELPPSSSLPSSQSGGATGIRRRQSLLYNSNKPKSRLVEPRLVKPKIVSPRFDEGYAPRARRSLEPIRKDDDDNDDDDDDDDDDAWGNEDEDEDDDDNDDEVYVSSSGGSHHVKAKKKVILMEWIPLFCMVGVLISSLCITRLNNFYIWGLNLWKWCLLILIVFCGYLVTKWLMDLLEFFIGRNFLLKQKVFYFIYDVKSSARLFLWLGVILLTWVSLITNKRSSSSSSSRRVLNYISRGIGCCLLCAVLWMVKDFLIKLLAASFHVMAFFDRIRDSIFHQYVLQFLLTSSLHPPPNGINTYDKDMGRLKIKKSKKKKKPGEEEEEVIQVDKLKNLKKEKVSAWTMRRLIKTICSSELSFISEVKENNNAVTVNKVIRSEFDAKLAAKHIFKKFPKKSYQYIAELDLLQFMSKEEATSLLKMFEEAAETGKIKKKYFKRLVVKIYQERKNLKFSLQDSKKTIEELNRIVTTCLIVIIIIVWLLLMGIMTTRVLVFISTQLLLFTFVFGNSAKTLFECLVFVFVTHPFDVGDRCVIDGVQMTVNEMKILSTSFLRYDNEMIYYPNSVLANKPISNFNRSPEMGDSVEFTIHFSTSFQSIAALKSRIKKYLESKPIHWMAGHSVTITSIEDMSKLKMLLCVTHTVSFQSPERAMRRSQLLLELKNIFEDLELTYHFVPEDLRVFLTNIAPRPTPSSS